jgi:glycosyltransferase involved in cell wall biosynthesis
MTKISICVPTYNRVKYLENLLDILVTLPNQNYEIIVVDNKSTDYTSEIFKNPKYKKVKYFQNQENIGMANNWNRCIELASGDYIIIVHDDDLVTPKLFTEYRKILKKYPDAGLIFSYAGIIDENARKLGYYKVLKGNIVFREASLFKLLITENFIRASGVLVKKDCYQKVGKFTNKYLFRNDHDMWLRISLYYSAIYRDDLLFNYRIHSENISLNFRQKRLLAENLNSLKNCYTLLNSNVKNYKNLRELIELFYRYKIKEYYQNYITAKNLKDSVKNIIKINLKFYLITTLEFIKSFIQKQPIFETKSLQKSHYYPFWAFGIILRSLKIYLNPPKIIGKTSLSFFKKMKSYFFS